MSFTCPRCEAVSHNPTDEREGYCARCHDWTELAAITDRLLGEVGIPAQPSAYWVLDEHEPVPASAEEWGRMVEQTGARLVDSTEFHVAGRAEPVHVSTVFLGLDHGFGRSARPVLFETMIFGGERDEEMRRYCTWDEAQAGHNEIVAEMKARCLGTEAG